MTKTELVNTVTRTVGRVGLKLKKHSPEILLVAGTVGVVASAVLACKATTKIHGVLDKTKENIDLVHQGVEDGQVISIVDGEEVVVPYNEEDGKKDLAIHYAKAGLEFAKIYGPSVILGLASLGCIYASSNIMRKRNLALAAAYMTEHTAFKDYRGRLVERFGEQLDRELKYNIKTKEVEETVVNENGTEQVVTKTVEVANVNEVSDYARFFDDGCKGWTKDPEMNLFRVRQVQNYANDKLKLQGYLFLNDVYGMFGIPKTKAGQCVGWVYNKTADGYEDGYIDFGVYDIHNERKRAFVNGYERNILLEFNVDGDILDMI